MIEIMGGGPLHESFIKFDVAATKTVSLIGKGEDEWLQVWEMSDEDFKKFDEYAHQPNAWSNGDGWWRYALSNLKNDLIEVQVANEPLKAFKSPRNYYHSEEYRIECLREGAEFELPSYFDLLEFLELYYGISKPENITYAVSSLAPLNGLTKAELLKKYVSSDKVLSF